MLQLLIYIIPLIGPKLMKHYTSKHAFLCIFLCIPLYIYSADSLVENLSHGKFSGKLDAQYKDGSTSNSHQNLFLEYDAPKISDVDIKLGLQSSNNDHKENTSSNQTFYSKASYDQKAPWFDYQLSANYFGTLYSPNEDTHTVTSQALGLKAAVSKDDFAGYIALSKVSDNAHNLYVPPPNSGKEKFLPTSSLLISNNDTPNTTAAAVDMKYNVNKGVALGSRYTVAENDTQLHSYSGVYSSFVLKNALEGLKVTLSYDKAVEGDDAKQWSLQFKNNF